MFRCVLVAAVLFGVLGLPAAAASCSEVPLGHVIVLKSVDLDPDVFVWDSRQRVADYAGGFWQNTHEVLAHSLLAKPGTHAQVVSCVGGAIQSRFTSGRLDAVGIRILNGPNKGRYGWVTSEDAHLIARLH